MSTDPSQEYTAQGGTLDFANGAVVTFTLPPTYDVCCGISAELVTYLGGGSIDIDIGGNQYTGQFGRNVAGIYQFTQSGQLVAFSFGGYFTLNLDGQQWQSGFMAVEGVPGISNYYCMVDFDATSVPEPGTLLLLGSGLLGLGPFIRRAALFSHP